jgi:membrane protein YdbS with pleckstrin-like domain
MELRLRQPANRVARAAILLWALESLLGVIVFAGVLALAAWGIGSSRPDWLPPALLDNVRWLPVVGGLVAGVPLVIVQPLVRYLVHRWEVTPEVVFTLTGWIDRRWHVVPISRIQTVDTDRGPLERMFGLATLKIHTASHAGSSEIAGLPAEVAGRLAQDLARQANQLRDDAT